MFLIEGSEFFFCDILAILNQIEVIFFTKDGCTPSFILLEDNLILGYEPRIDLEIFLAISTYITQKPLLRSGEDFDTEA